MPPRSTCATASTTAAASPRRCGTIARISTRYPLPAFGDQPLEGISAEAIDAWRNSLTGLSSPTSNKLLVVMGGVMRRAQHVWGLPANPVASVEKHRARSSGDIDVCSPEEVMALVRAAGSDQDAAIFLTAAFTGLRRGELLALRWRDVDFPGTAIRVRVSHAAGHLTMPKSGEVRSVPMAPDVAEALARLGQREHWTGDDDLVFCGETGDYLDGSALRRRYAAALRAGREPCDAGRDAARPRDTARRHRARYDRTTAVTGRARRSDEAMGERVIG